MATRGGRSASFARPFSIKKRLKNNVVPAVPG
jgi:hypothetical protein